METDTLKSLSIDTPSWARFIRPDDFIIAVSDKQSNSVYHVFSVKRKHYSKKRQIRHYLKVFKSDLNTALKREESQQLIPVCGFAFVGGFPALKP